MDRDAQKDFTYRMTEDEYCRYKKNWWISLNMSGKTRPVRNRSYFAEALTKLHSLHQESGEQQLRPVPLWKYQRWHQSSSSSSSWWQWQDSHRFLPGITKNGIRRLLHPAHLGGSGTIPG